MYESRAAYTPRPLTRRGLTFGLWAQWVGACILGATGGYALAYLVVSALVPDFTEGNFYTFGVGILAGAVMGGVIGVFQGAVLAQRMGRDGWRDWVLASALGGAVRWAILSPIIANLLTVRMGWNGAASVNDICVFFFAFMLFSALSGIAFGIPQFFVLRRHLGPATELDGPAWSLANALGGVLIIPIISLSGMNDEAVIALAGVVGVAGSELTGWLLFMIALTWASIALTTTIPLRDRLKGKME